MTLWQGSKAQLVTATAAAIGLPFYLGLVHTPVSQALYISGVAGAAMATGEYAMSPIKGDGLKLFLAEVAIWALAVGLIGAIAYLIALIF